MTDQISEHRQFWAVIYEQRCVLFYIDAAVQCRGGDPHDEHLPCEELPWWDKPQQRHRLTDSERHETHHHCWRRSRQLQEESVLMFRHMGLITCSISNTILCVTSLLLSMLICLYVLQFNCDIKHGWINSKCSKVKQSGTLNLLLQECLQVHTDLKSSSATNHIRNVHLFKNIPFSKIKKCLNIFLTVFVFAAESYWCMKHASLKWARKETPSESLRRTSDSHFLLSPKLILVTFSEDQ